MKKEIIENFALFFSFGILLLLVFEFVGTWEFVGTCDNSEECQVQRPTIFISDYQVIDSTNGDTLYIRFWMSNDSSDREKDTVWLDSRTIYEMDESSGSPIDDIWNDGEGIVY